MNVHYLTVGAPDGKPVLVRHGTAGSQAHPYVEPFAELSASVLEQ